MGYDFLLLSPWTEPVTISPDYQLIRSEISHCTAILAQRRIQNFLDTFKRPSFPIHEISKFWDQFLYSSLAPFCPGLLCVAAALEQAGARVRCVSLDIEKEKAGGDPNWLSQSLKRLCADTEIAVGITAVTPEYERARLVLSEVKRIAPNLTTIIGGTHVTYLDDVSVLDSSVDVVVRGEGEASIVSLYKILKEGERSHSVPGTTVKIGSKVVRNPSPSPIDLTRAPVPAYHLLDDETRQKIKITPTYSRGCPYTCDYCVESVFWDRRVRHKDPAQFVRELHYIADELQWKFIHIADSTFGIVPDAVDSLCEELERNPVNALFSINVRPNLFKYMGADRIKRLIRLGFVEWYIGAETADDSLIKALRRKQTFGELLNALSQLRDLGAPLVKLYLMVGIPDDTHEGLQATVNAVRLLIEQDLIFYATAKFFVPTPGTELFTGLRENAPGPVNGKWAQYERYNFPPWYKHSRMSVLELDQYLSLIQATQLSAMRQRLAPQDDPESAHAERIVLWAKENYLKRIYM